MIRQQLSALLYKSWLIQRRRWMWTLMELLLPLALTGALVAINFTVKKQQFPSRIYDPVPVKGDYRDLSGTNVDGYKIIGYSFSPTDIYYAPNTSFVNGIMSKLSKKLSPVQFWKKDVECNTYDNIPLVGKETTSDFSSFASTQGFENANELENSLYQRLLATYPTTFYAGIVFSDDFARETNSTNAQYQLRFTYEQRNVRPDEAAGTIVFTWSTEKDFTEDMNNLNPYPNASDGGIPSYWREGFLTLQRALDMILIETMAPESLCTLLNTTVSIERFPFAAHVKHPLIGLLPLLLPAVLVLSFILSALYITRSLTVEKETKLVEYIGVITGLKPWVQSLAHFMVNFVKLFIIVILITLMLSFTVLENSNTLLIGLFLFLYMLNVLEFSFIIASFFNSVNNATLCAGVLWFLLYIPCFYLQTKYSTLSKGEVLSFMLLPNAAVVVFCQMVSSLESQNLGLQWHNFVVAPFSKSKFVVYEAYLMLLASLLPPLLFRLLVDGCQFIVTKDSHWNGDYHPRRNSEPSQTTKVDSQCIEAHSANIKSSITLEKVSKVFSVGWSSTIKALNNLSLNIYPGELTVILGHNGAGKSTLMNILTGILKSTSGSAYVNNCDVVSEMSEIRKVIGYCPQYNMLFSQMTVSEHLKFFSILRGTQYDSVKSRCLLQKLSLLDKRHDFANVLSGGQKRRLCLAIALVNSAKIVLLDEATSGMDPSAKGDILELVKCEKQPDRTFVLVTHYVDEAETLGDRVAILSNGQLQCNGTNMFLKNRFGNGYRLTIRFKHNIDQNLQLLVGKILDIILDHCPGSSLLNFREIEAKYLLCPPSMASVISCSNLYALFESLEKLQNHLPIDSLSVSMPTMQDVFLNMYCKEKTEANRNASDPKNSFFLRPDTVNHGFTLFWQQIRVTVRKRALYMCRKTILLLAQWSVLVLTVGGSLILNHLLSGYRPKPPPKSMTLAPLVGTNFLMSSKHNTSASDGALKHSIETIVNSSGLKLVEPNLRYVNLSRYMLDQSINNGILEFMESAYMGLSMNHSELNDTLKMVGYFNSWAIHGASMVLNLIHNAILNVYCPRCSITTFNYPLPQATVLYYSFGEDFILVLCLAVGLAFFTTNFASSLVDEKNNGAKHMQILSGLHPLTYWLGTIMWDGPVFLIASLIIILLWLIGGCDLLIANKAWLDMVLLFLLHGWAILPFIYIFSMAFNNSAGAVTAMTAVNLVLNLVPTLTVTTLRALSVNDVSLQETEKWLSDIWSILIPQFTLSKAIMTYYGNKLMTKQCEAMKACDWLEQLNSDHFQITKTPLQWARPGIGRYLACFVGQGFVLVLLLALLEWYYTIYRRGLRSKFVECEKQSGDSLTMNRSLSTTKQTKLDYPLDVQEITVQYPGQMKPAVQYLSFRVNKGEIFGLNGQNGSGKTTTYKILTGQLLPNRGAAYINGINIVENWIQAARSIGFCPQNDSLLEMLTVTECLTHFGRIKGTPDNDVEDIASSLINAVGLKQYANRIVKNLSGGNKRKLSLAVAVLGAPPLILLDEPTCGVDPKARRQIWKLLSIVKQLNCAIVLTSHDMEECEALCNRVMIMVRGQSKCTGTPQSLLDQQERLYNLKLTVGPETDLDEFMHNVEKLFKNAELKSQPNKYQFHFAVPMRNMSWSGMFKKVEILKNNFNVTDFAICQPTLQETFITITRKSASSSDSSN